MEDTTVTFKTNKTIKKEAGKVFKNMGLNLSSGINAYLFNIAKTKKLPFKPEAVNFDSPIHIEKLKKQAKEVENGDFIEHDLLK